MTLEQILIALTSVKENSNHTVRWKTDVELTDGSHITKLTSCTCTLGADYGTRKATIAAKAALAAAGKTPKPSTPTVWLKEKFIKHCKNGNNVLLIYQVEDTPTTPLVSYVDASGEDVPYDAIKDVLPEPPAVKPDMFTKRIEDILDIC